MKRSIIQKIGSAILTGAVALSLVAGAFAQGKKNDKPPKEKVIIKKEEKKTPPPPPPKKHG